MPKQLAIPGLRDAVKKKVTGREQFLADMDVMAPWGRLLALISPDYPQAGLQGDDHLCLWRRCWGSISCKNGMR